MGWWDRWSSGCVSRASVLKLTWSTFSLLVLYSSSVLMLLNCFPIQLCLKTVFPGPLSSWSTISSFFLWSHFLSSFQWKYWKCEFLILLNQELHYTKGINLNFFFGQMAAIIYQVMWSQPVLRWWLWQIKQVNMETNMRIRCSQAALWWLAETNQQVRHEPPGSGRLHESDVYMQDMFSSLDTCSPQHIHPSIHLWSIHPPINLWRIPVSWMLSDPAIFSCSHTTAVEAHFYLFNGGFLPLEVIGGSRRYRCV